MPRKRVPRALLQPQSYALFVTGTDLPSSIELRRIRIDRWPLIYAVSDVDQWVWLLAIRRRPPYDYEDLSKLASRLSSPE